MELDPHNLFSNKGFGSPNIHPVRIHITKKHIRPGGMAPSEWTRSFTSLRDTLVADYSAPGVNTTRRIAYRPPIAVS